MQDKYYNPFQAIDIFVPSQYHEDVTRFSQREAGAVVDQSPFPRMVDLWFLAVCVAARLDLEPIDSKDHKTTKVIDGSIFGSDPWRVHTLMLIAIGKTGNVEIVSDPRQMMNVISGLAFAGLPKVIEMLKSGDGEPIWNLSDSVGSILKVNQPS
jgi:hypothetical protein